MHIFSFHPYVLRYFSLLCILDSFINKPVNLSLYSLYYIIDKKFSFVIIIKVSYILLYYSYDCIKNIIIEVKSLFFSDSGVFLEPKMSGFTESSLGMAFFHGYSEINYVVHCVFYPLFQENPN